MTANNEGILKLWSDDVLIVPALTLTGAGAIGKLIKDQGIFADCCHVVDS